MPTENNASGQSSLMGNKGACLFCRVVGNEVENYTIFQDESTLAFLDTKPLFPGHVLLVPKRHYDSYSEVPDETLAALFINVKKIATAMEKALNSEGEFIAVNNKVSQSVPHLHIHIVPRKFKDGLKGFFWPRYAYSSKDQIKEMQAKIIGSLEKNTISDKNTSSE